MKMVIGAYLIMVFDPEILFNEGFYDLLDIRVEDGTILKPRYPAPLGNRHHTLSRWVEVVAGALGRHVPETAVAAGYGSSPHMIFSGIDADGNEFGVVEILMGGIPARPAGDGMDGTAGTRSSRTRRASTRRSTTRSSRRRPASSPTRGAPVSIAGAAAFARSSASSLPARIDLRRPPYVLPVGDRRWTPWRTLAQAARPGRWDGRRTARQDRLRRGGARRQARLRDRGRGWLGQSAAATGGGRARRRREGIRVR